MASKEICALAFFISRQKRLFINQSDYANICKELFRWSKHRWLSWTFCLPAKCEWYQSASQSVFTSASGPWRPISVAVDQVANGEMPKAAIDQVEIFMAEILLFEDRICNKIKITTKNISIYHCNSFYGWTYNYIIKLNISVWVGVSGRVSVHLLNIKGIDDTKNKVCIFM